VPPGFQYALADIDYTPAVEAAHASLGLSVEEIRAIIHWIDFGMPRDIVVTRGWLADDLPPVIAWGDDGQQVVIGLHDVGSGLNMATLMITRDGAALIPVSLGDGRWSVEHASGLYMARVIDLAGNGQVKAIAVP
jgi:hypothetical protein